MAKRRQIEQQLSRTLSDGRKATHKFFTERKEQFMMKCTEMGLDLMTVKDFLEDRCIFEED